jgi:N-acetylglucosaminyl-diphospho-decaprenol L-rhamnosyltransferase
MQNNTLIDANVSISFIFTQIITGNQKQFPKRSNIFLPVLLNFFLRICKAVKLSIIIVNYNVKYFLEQSLCSVRKSMLMPGTEIIVVDNHSPDESIAYLQPKFPEVVFMEQQDNTGFAKANNIGLAKASGEYILFLNPDTILGEDSLKKCISLLDSKPEIGAVGVKMIDGSGYYLKESKRGFPSPWVSFCKLSGLTKLFPHSRLFASYYLGHIGEHENCEADVLSGAYMMVRKKILDTIGGFDEQFFMYAEDIDLCTRIKKTGYLNYYLADTTIIHFKGESTRRNFRYVKLFYKAMSQFTRKYFKGGFSFILTTLLDLAIWLRAGISLITQLFKPKGKESRQEGIKIFLTGEPGSVKLMTDKLISLRHIIVQKQEEADETVFCQGDNFTFMEIIGKLQKHPGRSHYMIHSAGSGSITGSSSKYFRGETIPL